jgi:FKBP-type peptidyl-prolyl cis-trans isomerase 2
MKEDNGFNKYYIALILLAAVLVVMMFLSNNAGGPVVEVGDTVMMDYTGKFLDGEVFDTSYSEIAIDAGLYEPDRPYEPLVFTVGSGQMIEGMDSGVLGMKEGKSKTLTIPPEKAYGQADPTKIEVIPQVDEIPTTQIISKDVEISRIQFNMSFDTEYKVGDTIQVPGTSINLTVVEFGDLVKLRYNMKVGDRIESGIWVDEVIDVNSTHITLKHDMEVGDNIQLPNYPWNTTVLDISKSNITLQHNPIPDTTFYTTVQTILGPQQVPVQIHFNESAVTLDSNHFLAGKTLVFDIEIVSIEKGDPE